MIITPGALAGAGRVAEAFDTRAASYDDLWCRSAIGSAQRAAVWRVLDRVFRPGDRVLDIGCGTGADAVHLARCGVRVHGIDISAGMVRAALKRIRRESLQDRVTVERRAVEDLPAGGKGEQYDGAVSNFGVLNCVEDPAAVAGRISRLVRPGGRLVICFMGRFCLWETVWYLSRGRASKAFRRLRGRSEAVTASLGSGPSFGIRYPSVGDLIGSFAPVFGLESWTGVGVLVPPSCLQGPAGSHPKLILALSRADRLLAARPLLRGLGDHRLLVFVRR